MMSSSVCHKQDYPLLLHGFAHPIWPLKVAEFAISGFDWEIAFAWVFWVVLATLEQGELPKGNLGQNLIEKLLFISSTPESLGKNERYFPYSLWLKSPGFFYPQA